jgi:putative ABC transport system ATP-binding protein
MPNSKYTNKASLDTFIEFYRGDWKDIFSILIYGTTVGIFSLVVPLASQSLVNTVAFATLLQPLIVLTAAVGLFMLFSSLLKLVQFFIAEKLAQRFMVRVALDLSQSIPMLQYDIFKRNFGSEYINRFLEIVTVQKATSVLLLEGSAVIFQLVFGIVLLGFYHPFFLAFSIAIAVILLSTVLLLGRKAIPTSVVESDRKYDLLAWLEDMAAAPALFKSGRGQHLAQRRADALLVSYIQARRAHFKILVTQQTVVLIMQVLGSAALLGVGGILVMRNQLSLGQLVAAELILAVILNNTDKLAKFLETFYDLVAGITKLNLLGSLPRDTHLGSEVLPASESGFHVRLENVSHILSHGETLLEDVCLDVRPGEKVLIIGGNGSGKSILADLIVGYKAPYRGTILIDDTSIDDIDCNAYRNQVALVRGVEVIHGTIEENLRIARHGILAREMREVLTELGLAKEIDTLSDGMRTYLKGDYAPLSLGQAERLMIARALLQRPRLMVFDASLDVIDEGMLEQSIRVVCERSPQTTLIALSRERDSIDFFDVVYALQNKRLVRLK